MTELRFIKVKGNIEQIMDGIMAAPEIAEPFR